MLKTCHQKGCSKLPTYHKARKTSGKFCAEHKKEGMVSIMYRHYNNQADEIFTKLPRELQWEILTDFVGGYVVRYNKLRRIMSGELQEKLVEHIFGLNQWSWRSLWLKPFVRFPFSDFDHLGMSILNRYLVLYYRSDGTLYDSWIDPELVEIVAVAEFSRRGECVVLFQSKVDGQLSYGVHTSRNKGFDGRWFIREVDDSVVLPPFEKHVYPSYPCTNKKMGRPVLKMKLHRPISEVVPEYLSYQQKRAWMEGRYIV